MGKSNSSNLPVCFFSHLSARLLLTVCIPLVCFALQAQAQTNDLSNKVVSALLSGPYNYIYAATDSGVFRSTNRGDTWTQINSGLTELSVKTFALDSAGSLYAATTQGHVFRSAKSVVSSVDETVGETPRSFSLEQNYPNPFNPSTTIQFSLLGSGHVTLKVFNVLGIEVATLMQEELRTGSYSIRWEPFDLPSGVYFCRLQVSGVIQTRKLILMK